MIFICPFDLFDRGRHIYTFENICKEDNSVFLNDGAVKIFLNASGKQDDVSKELKAFLDYVAGVESEDEFVQRVARAVREAKKNREWRREYMTLLMRDADCVGLSASYRRSFYSKLNSSQIMGTGGKCLSLFLSERMYMYNANQFL